MKTSKHIHTQLGHRIRHQGGFTLVEIMVVVVILGILAATILPQFIGTAHDAKVGMARSNIAELESAVEKFYIHMDRYPSTEEGLDALVTEPADTEGQWRGPYVKMLRPDPWKNPYQYRSPGQEGSPTFDPWSRGSDGADGGEGDGKDVTNWE